MLAFVLQAGQQAKEVAPNVYVTVQQPAGGIPEWEKTLITAAIGASVGILSSSFMEFLKPLLSKAASKREICRQLDVELKHNLDTLGVVSVMLDMHPQAVIGGRDGDTYTVSKMLGNIRDEKYRFYLETQKLIMFEISTSYLDTFYEITKKTLPAMAERAEGIRVGSPSTFTHRLDIEEYQEMPFQIRYAEFEARWFFETRKSSFVRAFNRSFGRDPGLLYVNEDAAKDKQP